jgi:hypothetical protein
MPEQQQFLADFLSAELKDYATLDGKAINHSNSHCIAEGEEDFAFNIHRPLPQDMNQVVARFYQQQGLQTKFYPGVVHVKKDGITVKYVVITGGKSGGHTLISVKRVS